MRKRKKDESLCRVPGCRTLWTVSSFTELCWDHWMDACKAGKSSLKEFWGKKPDKLLSWREYTTEELEQGFYLCGCGGEVPNDTTCIDCDLARDLDE